MAKLFMFLAPRDGRWIEVGGLRGGGTAYAYWTGSYWDDGAGYEVDGWWWRPCDQSLPMPVSRAALTKAREARS